MWPEWCHRWLDWIVREGQRHSRMQSNSLTVICTHLPYHTMKTQQDQDNYSTVNKPKVAKHGSGVVGSFQCGLCENEFTHSMFCLRKNKPLQVFSMANVNNVKKKCQSNLLHSHHFAVLTFDRERSLFVRWRWVIRQLFKSNCRSL